MICPNCEEERKPSDFLNSENCYKCEFRRKTEKFENDESFFCKMCGTQCGEGRWKYCSEECSILGKIENDNNNWTKKIKSVSNFTAKGIQVMKKRSS